MPSVTEVTCDPRLAPLVVTIETTPTGNDDFVRFQLASGDDLVADLVQSAELYDEQSRAILRTLLTSAAQDTLMLFAQRRVLSGRRSANQNHFRQALSAWSLLPTMNDVPWTTWFLASLVLGEFAHDTSIVALFEGPSTPGGIRCGALQRSLRRGGSLAQCHLAEVSTTYGVGMIELPLPRDVPARGWLDAPLIDKDDAFYAPTINLAQLTVDVADALDQLTNTRTSGIEFSLLSTGTSPFIRTLGCLHFCATTERTTWDVFVAQVESASKASRLEAELADDEGAAVSDRDLVIVFMAQPSFDDDERVPHDPTPLLDAANIVLRGAFH